MDEVILTQQFLNSPYLQEIIQSAIDTPPTPEDLKTQWYSTPEELVDNTPKTPYFVMPRTHELKIKRRPPHPNQPMAFLYNGHDVTQFFTGPLSSHLSWDAEIRSWRFPQYLEDNRGPVNDEFLPDIKDWWTLCLEARPLWLVQILDEIGPGLMTEHLSTPLSLLDVDLERVMSPLDLSNMQMKASTTLLLADGDASYLEMPRTPVMSRKSMCVSGFDTSCISSPMQVSPAKKLQYDEDLLPQSLRLLQDEEPPCATEKIDIRMSKNMSTETPRSTPRSTRKSVSNAVTATATRRSARIQGLPAESMTLPSSPARRRKGSI